MHFRMNISISSGSSITIGEPGRLLRVFFKLGDESLGVVRSCCFGESEGSHEKLDVTRSEDTKVILLMSWNF
jgi:hypothetical protein